MRVADGEAEDQSDEAGGQVVDFLVRRIAKSLGVPVSALTDATGPDLIGPNSEALNELRTLLNTFLQLDHPAARRRCLALAEAELARQQRGEQAHKP